MRTLYKPSPRDRRRTRNPNAAERRELARIEAALQRLA